MFFRARVQRTFFLVVLLASSLVDIPSVRADEARWGFGSDLGFTSGTVNGTVFTLGVNPEYYLDRNFSIGPMMQITPTGDLFQISFTGVARFRFRLDNNWNLVPYTGLGLIHVDLDRGNGPNRIDRNDTSWLIPIGLSLEYQATHNMALSSTIQVNLHDINLSPSLSQNDHTSVAALFGFRWGP